MRHFYPRSPCGERPSIDDLEPSTTRISIHALLAESDNTRSQPGKHNDLFLSTLSLRRATTGILLNLTLQQHFYPRSPCGERPNTRSQPGKHNDYFYPRSPCGERPLAPKQNPTQKRISIHALLAESDSRRSYHLLPTNISIHALLAESDPIFREINARRSIFLSTLSLRRATLDGASPLASRTFLSTLSLRRATLMASVA